MERELVYTSVIATYALKKGVLDSPKNISFQTNNNETNYTLRIKQCGNRTIAVSTDKPVGWAQLLEPLYCLERLLMVLDGAFIPLKDINFSGSPDNDNGQVVKSQVISQRLSYFTSDNHFTITEQLVDFQDVLNEPLFKRWQDLLKELAIVNQVYLYNLGKSGMPVDLRLAFLIELAEPMVEIVNAEKNLFPSLNPGDRGTSLKQCLNALYNSFGDVIFEKERKSDYGAFLSKLVDSRIRIMHIKRNQKKEYFNGKYCAYYMMKISLLYRRILLDLLDISYDRYKDNLKNITVKLDRWVLG
jgi:hypothetical protein